MRRPLAIALPALLLLLGAPASAPAKGIVGASVCGADGCREIADADHGLLERGAPADAPARPEPFVRVTVRIGVPDHVEPVRLLFLPRSELVLAEDGTSWTVPLARGELQAIARRVKPLAASKLAAAVSLAEAAPRNREPLPGEAVDAPAPAVVASRDDGSGVWWLAVPGAAIALAAGAALVRRRRRDAPGAAATTG